MIAAGRLRAAGRAACRGLALLVAGWSVALGAQGYPARPGAGGIIAVEVAAKSAPDGYTLLMAHFPLAITVNLVKVSFDPVRDFAPVTLIATTQNVLAVNPSVPAKSVKELIALAKSKPGELRYASGGNGTSMHVSAERFALMAGVVRKAGIRAE